MSHSEQRQSRPPLRGDRNQCPSCGELFNSTGAFDMHRAGDFGRSGKPAQRRCLTIDEMLALGMSKIEGGFWVKSQMDDAARQRRIDAGKKAQIAPRQTSRNRS